MSTLSPGLYIPSAEIPTTPVTIGWSVVLMMIGIDSSSDSPYSEGGGKVKSASTVGILAARLASVASPS